MTKKFFCGFEPAKMHREFTYTTKAFQDESWDLSNSKGYYLIESRVLSKKSKVIKREFNWKMNYIWIHTKLL